MIHGESNATHWCFVYASYVKQEFSEQLISRMIEYAQRKYNLRLSHDEAVEHLRSLGNLYITVSKIRARKHKRPQENQTHES